MLVGPGNAFVAEAKRQLYGRVGIDLLAGPTETLLLADDTVDGEMCATDLLGQAEHGPDLAGGAAHHLPPAGGSRPSPRSSVSSSPSPPPTWPSVAWDDYGRVILCDDNAEMLALANDLAFEHVQVMTGRRRRTSWPT